MLTGGKTMKRKEAIPRQYLLSTVGVLMVLVIIATIIFHLSKNVAHASSGDWTTFLQSNARTGYNPAETAINPTSVARLKVHWKIGAAGEISSQPVAVNGVVYWGSWSGVEHATNAVTGKDIWAVNLGTTYGSCGSTTYGVLSTPTVTSTTINGVDKTVVIVGGGKADLYALDATDGSTVWHTSLASSPAHFTYSSTAVFNGSVYVGVASLGDCPLSNGSVVRVDEATGTLQNTFNIVPNGCGGGSLWGSPAIDENAGMLYVATGNGKTCNGHSEPYARAIVALHTSDLSLASSWPIPKAQMTSDSDFGSTPTLFQATIQGTSRSLLGVANKNGIYYALDRTNLNTGPIWQAQLAVGGASPEAGNGSISASAYDGTYVYAAGGNTTIAGLACKGSVSALNPATGAFVWRSCVGKPVLAPVSAVPGLVIVGTGPNIAIVSASTGKSLFTYTDATKGSLFWGAASISNGMLYQGNLDGNLYALGL